MIQRLGPRTQILSKTPGGFGLGLVPSRLAPQATADMVCGFCSTGWGCGEGSGGRLHRLPGRRQRRRRRAGRQAPGRPDPAQGNGIRYKWRVKDEKVLSERMVWLPDQAQQVQLRFSDLRSALVGLVSGNVVEMRIAERGSLLGSAQKDRIWVREIRRLMPGGHQTPIVATDYTSDLTRVAAA